MNRIQSACTVKKLNFAALFVAVLALAGFANADGISSGHAHKGKKGHLKIAAATELGGTVLQPGDYTVREINSADGPVVEFVREIYNATAPEGLSPYEEEVVARVPSTEQALSERPKHTQLQSAPEAANAIALEIRGDAVEYLFEPSPVEGRSGAMASHADNTSQNEHYSGENSSF